MAISNVVQPIKQYSSKPLPQAYWNGADGSQSPLFANAGANLAPTNALNAIKSKGFSTPIKSISTKPDGSTTITSHTPTNNSSGSTDTSKTPPAKIDTSGGAGTFTGATGGLMGYGTGQNNNPLVGGSAQTQNTIATGNNNPIKTAQTGLQNIASNGSQQVQDATQALKNFQQQSAGLMASLQSNPNVAGDVASSRNNAVAQNLAAQGNALVQNLQNALSQQGQQITAGTNAGSLAQGQQGQQITAAEDVGQLGQNQQAQNIGALGTAGTLTQKTGNFPFVFDPTTGTYTNGSSGGTASANGIQFTGNVNQDAQTAAKAVIDGKMTYQQAQQSMSYAGSTANNFLNSAILNAGGDVSALEAQGQAKQSNITASATAATNAAVTANTNIYNTALQNVANLQGQLGTVDQLGQLLVSTGSIAGVSPTASQLANKTINDVENQFSANANFISTMATLKEKIGGLLAIGGSGLPTAIANDMNDVMSGNLEFSKIPSLLKQIQSEGSIILGNQQNIASYAATNLKNVGGTMAGSNTTTSGTGGTSSKTASGLTYTITP